MKRNFDTRHFAILALTLLLFSSVAQAQTFTVSGKLEIDDSSAPGMAILASGTETKMAYTDPDGNYSFELLAGGAYEIRPLDCGQWPLNGVSTFDMVLIYKHYSGTEPLNSPYKIIAADIDNSNSVNDQDTSLLRQLILGVITQMPGNNYRFVPKDYVFPDPTDPFTPPFPEAVNIANLQGSLSGIDFIGVKKGDVNNSSVHLAFCNDVDLPARIVGKVFRDEDNDCTLDSLEKGMGAWVVSASDGNSTFFATANALGQYEIKALQGTYQVSLHNPEGIWGGCPESVPGVPAGTQIPGEANFGLSPQQFCPSMQIDISAPFLRRCFTSYYNVQYCNTGTVTADNAWAEVMFDPFIEVQASSLPWTSVNGNTYTFPLGDVPSGACGNFTVAVKVSCDAVLGQSHCSEARIFPDDDCSDFGAWNGARLSVEGVCSGDEVRFTITNKGADMLASSSYIVVEDIIVMMPPISNPFTLASQASETITVPANGATWRLEVKQPDGYPWGKVASATVEGCGTNAAGGFTVGLVNQFPLDDQNPRMDIDCQENIGSYDPNDKQGFPTGVLSERYIPLGQPIDYLIRFQNTGTDTAFTVIIRDTLDADFDPSSFRMLNSSHPCAFSLVGENVAQFIFANIMLPDSNVNEAASHGYVKFRILPRSSISNGTEVENSAAIYFDFNEPVITNLTLHTFGEKYLRTDRLPNLAPAVETYPNPANSWVNFILKSTVPEQGQLTIYDMQGRAVATQHFVQNEFRVDCRSLPPSCYHYRLSVASGATAFGKIVVMDK